MDRIAEGRLTVFRFDEDTHTYTWNGVRVPNVTSILKPLVDLSRIPAEVLEKARQEGVAVHKMIDLDAAGTLDVDALPEWMGPVYGAWCRFKEESGFTPLLSEYRGYHPTLRYAGTLDSLCELPKLSGWSGVSLIDVKRSLFAGPVIGLQLAAYKAIVESDKAMPKVARVGALAIKGGKFVLEPYGDPSDFSVFLALLTLNNWRSKHGYQPEHA